jgi:hypothetical protein
MDYALFIAAGGRNPIEASGGIGCAFLLKTIGNRSFFGVRKQAAALHINLHSCQCVEGID